MNEENVWLIIGFIFLWSEPLTVLYFLTALGVTDMVLRVLQFYKEENVK